MNRQPTADSQQPTAQSEQRVGAALAAAQGGDKPRPYPFFALAILLGLASGTAAAETIRLDAEGVAARAVRVSHVAAAADARLAATNETVKAADAATLPSFALGASLYQRSSVPEFAAPINGPLQPAVVLNPDITTTYWTSLRLQQAVYSGGAITGQREATRHDAQASVAYRSITVADLRLSAQILYWEAVRAAASVVVARAQEERARRLLDDTKALFDAGMAVRGRLAAEERIASAHVQLIVAQTQADNSLAQLRSLLQIEPLDTVELSDSLAGPLPSPPATEEQLQGQAVARRPEFAASAAQIAALRSRQKVTSAPVLPSVGAVAQLDYSLPNLRYFPQQDQWNETWSVGLLASWTLFDGGKARADTATVQFSERAALQDRDELTRRILVEVQNDRRNLERALAAVLAADAARAAGIEREKEAQERHAAGLVSMVDVLDAQAQLASAEQQQVNVRAASWIAASCSQGHRPMNAGFPHSVVTARTLTRTFGRFVAVDKVSFEVYPGEIFGSWAQRAGKTTTIRMLSGLLARRRPASCSASMSRRRPRRSSGGSVTCHNGFPLQRPHRRREPALLGRHLRAIRLGDREPGRVGSQDRRPRGKARHTGSKPPRRVPAAARPGGCPPPRAPDRLPRRADRRRGPRGQAPLLGPHRRAGRRGQDRFVTTHYMDEAERCHRVALMHAGRLLALDSVPQLKRVFLPGTIVEVSCSRPAQAMAKLERLPGVSEVALFGSGLHVVLSEPDVASTLNESLTTAGCEHVTIRAISPSLEDVFIRVIARAEGEAA
jgi:ABC-2 type transport system ATP-binding protein